jgi:hypothetical protein
VKSRSRERRSRWQPGQGARHLVLRLGASRLFFFTATLLLLLLLLRRSGDSSSSSSSSSPSSPQPRSGCPPAPSPGAPRIVTNPHPPFDLRARGFALSCARPAPFLRRASESVGEPREDGEGLSLPTCISFLFLGTLGEVVVVGGGRLCGGAPHLESRSRVRTQWVVARLVVDFPAEGCDRPRDPNRQVQEQGARRTKASGTK